MLVLVTPLLSSCFTYKNLTKKAPITHDLLSRLKPGKKYKFELKIGEVQKIYISDVTGETVTGYLYQEGKLVTNKNRQSVSSITGQIEYQEVYVKETKSDYSDNFENITRNVTKISRRKFDPFKTAALVVLPSAAVIGILFIPYSIPIVLTP
jgi:hypothetical protein